FAYRHRKNSRGRDQRWSRTSSDRHPDKTRNGGEKMNRRTFTRTAGGILAGSMLPFRATVAGASSAPVANGKSAEAPFGLSVMLWTIFRDLPFEQRLEKVAQAGYTNVELVGEYETWSEQDFDRANAKRKQLGITFDCTA